MGKISIINSVYSCTKVYDFIKYDYKFYLRIEFI